MVIKAWGRSFDGLFKSLVTKEEENKYLHAKGKKRKIRDLDYVKRINDIEGKVLVIKPNIKRKNWKIRDVFCSQIG